MEHYFMTFQNDGMEIYGTKCPTLRAAIKELKEAYRADFEECEGEPGHDYYVQEFYETDDTLQYGIRIDYDLSMGPRGGVRCVCVG